MKLSYFTIHIEGEALGIRIDNKFLSMLEWKHWKLAS